MFMRWLLCLLLDQRGMAKVKAPLFSFGATGQLAKSLVFMTWKGIKDVRQHVIPANPKTADQTTQRGFMTTTIALWHATSFIAADLTAWNLLASKLSKIMSGFNAYVSLYVKILVDSLTQKKVFNYDKTTPGSTTYTITFDTDLTAAKECTLKYGTDIDVLLSSEDAASDGSNVAFSLTGLTASTKYYCKVVPKDATERVYSGIYTFTTTAP